MPDSKIKVLYIAGFERSGSTVINRVLGQVDGFVAWGELRDIWEHGMIENRGCTCGALFRECTSWTKVLDRAFGGINEVDANEMLNLLQKTRAMVLPHYLGIAKRDFLKTNSKQYLESLESLYQAIQTTTNCKVIVDSTKASWYGYILGLLPTIDLYVVHVVRDPRGVCYSLQQRKIKGESQCQWYNPLHASLSWNVKNSLVEMLLNHSSERYLRISYENFIQNPKLVVESILSLLQEKIAELPFKDDSTVNMDVDHIITGSPSSRSETGAVKLRLDERWKKEMNQIDKVMIKSLTSPLLQKYGYLI